MDAAASDLVLRAFAAVEWSATQEPETPNSFAIGQLAFFLTSPLTDHVTVLAEVVMEASTETRVVTDVERLLLTYRLNDHLQVSGGRYHTGIGFYNAEFHHGAYFDTVIGRPWVYRFEDEGGVLPVHDVGLTVGGAVPRTGGALQYLAEIGNGRAWDETDDEIRDRNDAKATNVGLSFRPERWRGLEVGTSFYRDLIPQDAGPSIRHRIAAVYAVFRNPATEVMAEWLHLSSRPAGGRTYGNHVGYFQASRAWGMLRPYYRYDRLTLQSETPLIGLIGPSRGHTLGLRADPAERVGLKLQYERADLGRHRGVDAVRAQLVFVF
jgi:hypothetical protein